MKEEPVLLFALLWSLVFMAPSLGFVPMGRLLYFSVFGYALFMGLGLSLIGRAIRGRTRRKVFWGAVLVYFVVVPAVADLAFIPLINKQARSITTDFDAMLMEFVEKNPESEELFLLDAPNLAAAFTVKVMFPFYHPDLPQRIHILSNDSKPPRVEFPDERTLVVHNPEGIIRTGAAGFQTRHLSEGYRCRRGPFMSEILRIDDGKVTSVAYTFDDPVLSSRYAFAHVVGRKLERLRSREAFQRLGDDS